MASVASGTGSRNRVETDPALNIVSIIDCLTVLIIYLLAAASFVSLGSLDSSVGNLGKGAGATALVPVLMVQLKASRGIEVSLIPPQATRAIVTQLQARGGSWDFAGTRTVIESAQNQFPTLDSVVLVSDSTVPYGNVVRAAEILRASLPVVLGVGDEP